MRGAEETSSQPSAPAPLIQASNPLSIPSSVSLKMTILSKYSHCMVSLLLLRTLAHRTAWLTPYEVIGQPSAGGFSGRAAEAQSAWIAPNREGAQQAIFVLKVPPDCL